MHPPLTGYSEATTCVTGEIPSWCRSRLRPNLATRARSGGPLSLSTAALLLSSVRFSGEGSTCWVPVADTLEPMAGLTYEMAEPSALFSRIQ